MHSLPVVTVGTALPAPHCLFSAPILQARAPAPDSRAPVPVPCWLQLQLKTASFLNQLGCNSARCTLPTSMQAACGATGCAYREAAPPRPAQLRRTIKASPGCRPRAAAHGRMACSLCVASATCRRLAARAASSMRISSCDTASRCCKSCSRVSACSSRGQRGGGGGGSRRRWREAGRQQGALSAGTAALLQGLALKGHHGGRSRAAAAAGRQAWACCLRCRARPHELDGPCHLAPPRWLAPRANAKTSGGRKLATRGRGPQPVGRAGGAGRSRSGAPGP